MKQNTPRLATCRPYLPPIINHASNKGGSMYDEEETALNINRIIVLRGILGKVYPLLYGVKEDFYYQDNKAPCLWCNIHHGRGWIIRGGNQYQIYLSHLKDSVRFRIKEGSTTLFEKDFLLADPKMIEDLKDFAKNALLLFDIAYHSWGF